jgi:hypothetical protein
VVAAYSLGMAVFIMTAATLAACTAATVSIGRRFTRRLTACGPAPLDI